VFLPKAKPPVILPVLGPVAVSACEYVAKALTLPLMSNVQSPAGIIIPALAAEAPSAKTAPAAVCMYANLR